MSGTLSALGKAIIPLTDDMFIIGYNKYNSQKRRKKANDKEFITDSARKLVKESGVNDILRPTAVVMGESAEIDPFRLFRWFRKARKAEEIIQDAVNNPDGDDKNG